MQSSKDFSIASDIPTNSTFSFSSFSMNSFMILSSLFNLERPLILSGSKKSVG